MKQIAKGSSILTGVSIGEMFTRFVRTKCIALLLGTTGTGFLAQITICFEALRLLGDLGARRAVIKQIAEHRAEGPTSQRYREVVQTSFCLTLLSSTTVGLFVILFSSQLSQFLFQTPVHYPFIIFVGALLPIASLCTVTSSIVKGNLDYMAFAIYTLAAYVAVVILTPALLYFYREWGGVVTQGLFFVFPLIAYLVLNFKKRFLYFSGGISKKALKEQFSQGFLQIYQDFWTHLLRIVMGILIVHNLGLDAMGIYQVVITFTTVYMSIPLHAMNGYVFPLIASSKTDEEVNMAINESMRFLIFVLVPIIVLVMVLPELLIHFFFSKEFLPAVSVLQVQLLNTLFIVMSYPYSIALVARGKLKSVYIGSTIYPLFFGLLAWALVPHGHLMGIAIAFAISGLQHYVSQWYFSRKHFRTALFPKNQKLIAMTFLWIGLTFAGMYYANHIAVRLFLLAFGGVWFWVSSKDHERQFLWTIPEKILRRFPVVKRPV
jgi:PST family polysaccharide transporter